MEKSLRQKSTDCVKKVPNKISVSKYGVYYVRKVPILSYFHLSLSITSKKYQISAQFHPLAVAITSKKYQTINTLKMLILLRQKSTDLGWKYWGGYYVKKVPCYVWFENNVTIFQTTHKTLNNGVLVALRQNKGLFALSLTNNSPDHF